MVAHRAAHILIRQMYQDRDELRQFLINVIGSGHPLNIDGIGGGDAVTTKVAIYPPLMITGQTLIIFLLSEC